MWSTLLLPVEYAYRAGIAGRRFLYRAGVFRTRRLPVPVVSVGNLTLGGTGKTPVTMLLAREALRRGFRPAVLTRGYKGSAGGGVHPVSDGRDILLDAERAGDEARLMAEALPGVPVVKSPVRFDGGTYAVREYGADLLILDDGYQHWALARDVNVLLVDGERPAAGGRCVPAGPLREPIGAADRADVVLAVGNHDPGAVSAELGLRPSVPVYGAVLRVDGYREGRGCDLRPAGELRGRRVFVLCGIARPERFLRSVEALGARVVGWETFRDHHRYLPAEEKALIRRARDAGAEMLLTTEKDAVRLTSASFGTLVVGMECDPGFLDFVFTRVGSAGSGTARWKST